MREDGVMLLVCLFLLVCLPNHLLVASPSSSFSCHPDQRHALLRFKDSFSITVPYCWNTSYPNVDSWSEDGDCCSWEGVTCDNSTGDVINLDLTCAGLQGSINFSSPLFSLRHLRSLSLSGNNLLGSAVPPEIGMFTRLEYLNLSWSGISGILPTEISQLSKMVSLDLSGNFLLEMQDHTMRMLIQNLTQMEELNLGSVDMSTVTPISFMNFSSCFISLQLFGCSLGGKFPEYIFGLPNLQMIDLSWNDHLTGTLPESKWSPRLDYLSLSRCSFTGAIPYSIGNLSRLTFLDLSYNNFNGLSAIPYSIGNLSRLTFLDLSYNNFNGLTISGEDANHEFSLPKLQELHMVNCNLSKFPTFLSRSKELRILDLWRNKIQEIPSWLGSIGTDTLQRLALNDNNIMEGSIPQSICQLASLSFIDLYGNKLTGVIPQCIGNLTDLQYLALSNNSLSGTLPPSLANCTSLWNLDVSYNSIGGALPTLSTSLNFLDVSYNNIKGSIPRSICQMASLSFIYLYGNKLMGVIPQCIGNLTDLQELDLSNNSLSGTLPSSLANCTSLRKLDVSYNSFVGRWPPHIFLRSIYLFSIYLSDNKFEGPFPLPSQATNYYSVSNNNFSGEISSLICNATTLAFLDLSNNSFMGTLPDCLKNVTMGLSYLNLRANEFRGQIPEMFCKGSSLFGLDLSRNQFEGSLPRSLSNCKGLEALDVGNNNIVDLFPNWLGDLPLKVLSLRSNSFHGNINFLKGTHNFTKVRILDLSNNDFEGDISDKVMDELLGMTRDYNYDLFYQYMSPRDGQGYYSVMIDLKGIEMEVVKINVRFAMLDLSSNHFRGEIPRNIGILKSLKGLNLSHNGFTGIIPLSVGNLTNLESLDLSSNHLMGEIPKELVKLTFLEILDLSRNNLTGPIPSGGHFNTFPYSSFEGNPGLCGIPLTRLCGQGHKEAQPPPEEKDNGEEGGGWLEWEYVAMGFGSGMGLGISLGYMVLEIGRPLWLVRMVMSFITL